MHRKISIDDLIISLKRAKWRIIQTEIMFLQKRFILPDKDACTFLAFTSKTGQEEFFEFGERAQALKTFPT